MNEDNNSKTSSAEGSPEAEATMKTDAKKGSDKPAEKPKEFGGRSGPEPTRYGDWEKNGIISDF